MFLEDKKILFIGPKFYNYHTAIINQLNEFGGKVDYYPEVLDDFLYRLAKNYSERLKKALEIVYMNKIVRQMDEGYDYFFLIRGEILTDKFLKFLKCKSPNAKFIMYQWDSSKNNPNFLSLLSSFDDVMTFDREDSVKYNLSYLPLFYTQDYKKIVLQEKKRYDIVFFGAYHGDRLEIVKKISKEALKQKLCIHLIVYISKMALVLRLLKREITFGDLKYLRTVKVSQKEILSAYSTTKAVLDIENYGQKGLTMRTLEVLGSGLKLITTNIFIKYESFYSKEQVLIIDRKSPLLNENFFQDNNFQKMNIVNNYSLENWLKKIFKLYEQ